ncbi:MAG: cell division protein FtsA [Candidatus Azobacteroides sp.]|nr:cell division protein FtsA [Candidatus Azobacteroides sp.]
MGQIVAALDLGTSKSMALVARKDFSGKLSVLCTEMMPSNQAIRRGRVYNTDGTSEIISKLIGRLNNNLSSPIEKIYAGIGGQSIHTKLFTVEREVEGGTINRPLLESIKEEAYCHEPEFEENLGVASWEYYADGQLVSNPQGTVASHLEAKFQLVIGNPCLKRNLETVFNKNGIAVAGYFVSPLATAEAVLTPEEKESGCALVEWGEGVTYVSIYKNKALKYLATLPLGGLAVTKDIRSLNVSEEEAEALKIKYGSAFSESTDSGDVPVNEEQSSSRKIELKDLNWIIESRVDEIVKNIGSQIQTSGYSQMLDAGIVITGGGALLRDLPQFIREQTGKEVRLANAKVWINQVETQLSPAESCVVGLVILGKDNCVKEKEPEPKRPGSPPGCVLPVDTQGGSTDDNPSDGEPKNPVTHRPSGFNKFGRKIKKIINRQINDLFTDEDFVDNNTNKQ